MPNETKRDYPFGNESDEDLILGMGDLSNKERKWEIVLWQRQAELQRRFSNRVETLNNRLVWLNSALTALTVLLVVLTIVMVFR